MNVRQRLNFSFFSVSRANTVNMNAPPLVNILVSLSLSVCEV
jgi:hypothetical protein